MISIGNLVSGGTGKTPMTLWLIRRLKEMGWRPAIVSRGYGHNSKETVTVVSDGVGPPLAPPLAADEAAYLAERLPDVPVLCAPQRAQAIALAYDLLNCNLVVLDDGFQHLAVKRTVDLVLLDTQAPWGNGRLLPAGVLREFPSALNRAHVVILTRCPQPEAGQALRQELTRRWPHLAVLIADHRAVGWRLLGQGVVDGPPDPVLAFCGIARPDSFRASLESKGCTVTDLHMYNDHHAYTAADMDHLVTQAQRTGATALVCTAKDAVKLRYLPCELPIYYLEVDIFFPEGAGRLLQELDRRLAVVETE